MKQKMIFRFAMMVGMAIVVAAAIAYLQSEYPTMLEFLDQIVKSRIVPF